jgi:beta-lactamase regulating signal transducer with metallopeptidase domain
VSLPFDAFAVVATAAATLLHGTALAILTKGACRLAGRRIRPSLQAALWTLVLLKFFLPPTLPGVVTFSGWLSNVFSTPSSAPMEPGVALTDLVLVPAPAEDPGRIPVPPPLQEPSRSVAAGRIGLLLLGAYLVGFLFVAPRSLLGWHRTWRRVRSLPRGPSGLVEEVGVLARRIGLRRAPEVYVCPDDSSPFVAGVRRPVLVLPRSLLESTTPAAREPLVLHELAHVRRGDLVVRLLQNVARLLFYFWPPVWWVCRSIERSTELACDEWALTVSSVDPRAYAASLLEIARGRRPTFIGSQALALAPNGRFLQERFEMILSHESKRSPRLSGLAIAAVLAWAAFSLGGGAAAEEKNPGKTRSDVLFVRRAPMPGHGFASRWAALLFLQPAADRNADGEVTDEEAMAFVESRSAAERARLMKIAPNADLDRDGQLDAREVYGLLDGRLNRPFAHGPRIEIVNPPEEEADGDGKISEEEAHRYLEEQHPDQPVEFEWKTETNEDGQHNVERKVIRWAPEGAGRKSPKP